MPAIERFYVTIPTENGGYTYTSESGKGTRLEEIAAIAAHAHKLPIDLITVTPAQEKPC